MIKRHRILLLAAVFASLSPLVFADVTDTQPTLDPARPAIGDWIGQVSWNDPMVAYAWRIHPDGAFSSGRLGRGYGGGGAWNTNGAHVTLKYDDGFRYEGELRDNTYSGTAYRANGQAFGGFAMWREVKRLSGAGAYDE